MSQSPDEQLGTQDEPGQNTGTPSSEQPPGQEKAQEYSEGEKSILKQVAEIGEEALHRLKEVFADVDKEELRRSVNAENIRRSVASTLDSLNTRVQSYLAPKEGQPRQEAPGQQPGSTGPDAGDTPAAGQPPAGE